MEHNEFSYEVIFSLRPARAPGSKRHFHWCWVRLRHGRDVIARGELCSTLQAAISSAIAHRAEHGGGAIKVNIHESPHAAVFDAAERSH